MHSFDSPLGLTLVRRPIAGSPLCPETSPFLTQMASSCSLVYRVKLLEMQKFGASTSESITLAILSQFEYREKKIKMKFQFIFKG